MDTLNNQLKYEAEKWANKNPKMAEMIEKIIDNPELAEQLDKEMDNLEKLENIKIDL